MRLSKTIIRKLLNQLRFLQFLLVQFQVFLLELFGFEPLPSGRESTSLSHQQNSNPYFRKHKCIYDMGNWNLEEKNQIIEGCAWFTKRLDKEILKLQRKK